MRTEELIQKISSRGTERAKEGERESTLISEKPGLLAQCDVGLGPNQSDNTFEIFNSFLVNQLSPFHGCLEQITGSTLLTISPKRLLPCQSRFKIPIRPSSSLTHSPTDTHTHTQTNTLVSVHTKHHASTCSHCFSFLNFNYLHLPFACGSPVFEVHTACTCIYAVSRTHGQALPLW